MATFRFQTVNPMKKTKTMRTPPTVASTIQSVISMCIPSRGTMIIRTRDGNRSSDLSMATVGSDRLIGIPAIRLSMSVLAISPLLNEKRKLTKMPTRHTRIAVLALIGLMEFRKSFQRSPRMENARIRARPERRAKIRPRGVVRFFKTTSKLATKFTTRETRNNKTMPINRLMITFVTGLFSTCFIILPFH
jgi:hypothetical protein